MAVGPITVYTNTNTISPNAHRALIALEEAGLKYETVEISLANRPAWYAANINPANKVPALVYGGAAHEDTSSPPADAFKLAESLIITEFVADLNPDCTLLPKDPIQRAKARFIIQVFQDKYLAAWQPFLMGQADEEGYVSFLKEIEKLLDLEGPYALGKEWTIADNAIAPFVGRYDMLLENDIGKWPKGAGPKLLQRLQGMRRWTTFAKALRERKSFQDTFKPEATLELAKMFYRR